MPRQHHAWRRNPLCTCFPPRYVHPRFSRCHEATASLHCRESKCGLLAAGDSSWRRSAGAAGMPPGTVAVTRLFLSVAFGVKPPTPFVVGVFAGAGKMCLKLACTPVADAGKMCLKLGCTPFEATTPFLRAGGVVAAAAG